VFPLDFIFKFRNPES